MDSSPSHTNAMYASHWLVLSSVFLLRSPEGWCDMTQKPVYRSRLSCLCQTHTTPTPRNMPKLSVHAWTARREFVFITDEDDLWQKMNSKTGRQKSCGTQHFIRNGGNWPRVPLWAQVVDIRNPMGVNRSGSV